MRKMTLNRIEYGLMILNRICLHYLHSPDLYSEDAKEIVVDAVARLVSSMKTRKGLAIDHVDGDPTNNSFDNIRVVTLSENLR